MPYKTFPNQNSSILLLLLVLLSACNSNKRTNVGCEVAPEDIYANERYDSDNLDLDSLVLSIFPNVDSFAKEISRIGFKTVFSSYSEDGKARLFSVHCGGTMCSGTSYILYKKDDGTTSIKKIADMVPAEEGGMNCPALYMDIHDSKDGYLALGRFSFSSVDSVYMDTLFVSKEFLETDEFCFEER